MAVENIDPAATLGAEGLAGLVAAALDGLALLDGSGRYAHVNPAGCRILGLPLDELLGRAAVFGTPARDGDGGTRTARLMTPAHPRERDLEYRTAPVVLAGRGGTAVSFRDVTEVRLQRGRLAAFTAAAANVADAGTLRTTLDAICAEMVRTTDLAAAQILLMDPEGLRMRVHGAAPAAAWPADFVLLLEEARRRGAQLGTLEAVRTRRPVVRSRYKDRLLADAAWEPLHAQFAGFEWATYVSAPLLVREAALGALNAYYLPGRDPDADDLAFLTSMADHAAIAVQNARLLAESRGKAALDERHRLARELHDSACQQLFSMSLHIRAAQLGLSGHRPADASTRRSLETVNELALAALEDLRALIFELYPTLLHSEGLVAVVRQAAASAASRLGITVTVTAPDERLDIDTGVELDAHRLVQEALHNSVKHAEASSVSVRIGPDPVDATTLLLDVVDDGRGFDPSGATPGLGLVSMRERAERLGGRLTITSRPGAGTAVCAVVPRALPPDAAGGEPR
jgi:signal transduction histidine kinase